MRFYFITATPFENYTLRAMHRVFNVVGPGVTIEIHVGPMDRYESIKLVLLRQKMVIKFSMFLVGPHTSTFGVAPRENQNVHRKWIMNPVASIDFQNMSSQVHRLLLIQCYGSIDFPLME